MKAAAKFLKVFNFELTEAEKIEFSETTNPKRKSYLRQLFRRNEKFIKVGQSENVKGKPVIEVESIHFN